MLHESLIKLLKIVLKGVTTIDRDFEYRDKVQIRLTARTSRESEFSVLEVSRHRARDSESLIRLRIFTKSSGGNSSMVFGNSKEDEEAENEILLEFKASTFKSLNYPHEF